MTGTYFRFACFRPSELIVKSAVWSDGFKSS